MEPRTDRLWTTDEMAGSLGVPVNTVYQWRCKGYGPKARRIGRHLRWDPNTVRAWVEAQDVA